MKISQEQRKLLLDAFDEIIPQYESAQYLAEKLYFFSASFGIVNRVMNFSCDPLLIFMHQELQATHQNLINRASQPVSQENISIAGTPTAFIDALLDCTKKLRELIDNDDDEGIRLVLQRISNISYATTGNGYYLYVTGKLEI